MFELFKKKKIIKVKSPVNGIAIDITTVNDQVFATKMIGDGIAFEPSEGILYSPVDGEIVNVFPTKHAVGIKTREGIEILIHIGIETVNLKGEGFESCVSEKQKVKAGDELMSFDLNLIKSKGYETTILVIITNMDIVDSIDVKYGKCNKSSTPMEIKIK